VNFSGDAEGAMSPSEQHRKALEEAKVLKKRLESFNELEDKLNKEMFELALELPNLSSRYTPLGTDPEVLGYINDHLEPLALASDRVWRSHTHIGMELDLLDFDGAAKASGWGWYYLKNEAAQLEQALIQYAINVALKRGWKLVTPPSMVYAHVAAACGFQPRDQHGEQQVYTIEQSEKDRAKPQMALAGTGEIPLAGMMASQILEESQLPIKLIGVSRCYRAEAGARGVDSKGLYRVHEFTKVEMFAWTMPDSTIVTQGDEIFKESSRLDSQADSVFNEMLQIQQEILRDLDLHCRILEMPTADLGASATRKRDIEAFFPSRREKHDGWGEVCSLSLCTDYQTRRLSTRVKIENGTSKRLDFPWTINGTALAVPRVLAAVLENHWNEERIEVRIPECLRSWMGGKEVISASKLFQASEVSA
jgi:seryl-tRNA synthetase